MTAYRTCLALSFTASLACDDGLNPPDTPTQGTYESQSIPGAVSDLPDEIGESSSTLGTTYETLPEEDTFCLPFEINNCHSTTSRVLVDCPLDDCVCQVQIIYTEYAVDTAECLNLACPRDYPDPDLLASCYYDWFSSIEGCLRASPCSDWALDCPETGIIHKLQFLRSCLAQ